MAVEIAPSGQHTLPQAKLFQFVERVSIEQNSRVLSDPSQEGRLICQVESAFMDCQRGGASEETIDVPGSCDGKRSGLAGAEEIFLRALQAEAGGRIATGE